MSLFTLASVFLQSAFSGSSILRTYPCSHHWPLLQSLLDLASLCCLHRPLISNTFRFATQIWTPVTNKSNTDRSNWHQKVMSSSSNFRYPTYLVVLLLVCNLFPFGANRRCSDLSSGDWPTERPIRTPIAGKRRKDRRISRTETDWRVSLGRRPSEARLRYSPSPLSWQTRLPLAARTISADLDLQIQPQAVCSLSFGPLGKILSRRLELWREFELGRFFIVPVEKWLYRKNKFSWSTLEGRL